MTAPTERQIRDAVDAAVREWYLDAEAATTAAVDDIAGLYDLDDVGDDGLAEYDQLTSDLGLRPGVLLASVQSQIRVGLLAAVRRFAADHPDARLSEREEVHA